MEVMGITAPHPRLAPTTQVQSSELSRNPAAVFLAAEQGPVTITRRDGETLVMETKAASDERQEILQIASAFIAIAVSTNSDEFLDGLAGPFPWIALLSKREQRDFSTDLVNIARACFAVNQHKLLIGTINGWKATAEAYAAGLGREPIVWLPESEDAENPNEA